MALWLFHTDADGHVARVTPGAKDASFFRAMRALPVVPLRDDEIAWPGERWAYANMAQGDWEQLGVYGFDRSDA